MRLLKTSAETCQLQIETLLLDTIRDLLGDDRYTDEIAGAWESTIDSLAQMMQRGAQRDRTS